jgi:hypothetical protein
MQPHILKGVISCLYGLELRISRSEALGVLDVLNFLKVSKLKKLIEEDIIANLEEYDFFLLL